MDRKKICKIMAGSHLYGTNGPNSDRDFYGVFLPSRVDLLGLKPYPGEIAENVKVSEGVRNTAQDIDCKYFSLSKFFLLAAEGQPGQLELLFAQDMHHVEPVTSEWREIIAKRDLFISKRAIVPFIRFAEAQAHKAVMKGENLENIQRIIDWSKTADPKTLGQPIRECIRHSGSIGPVSLQIFANESGADLIEIAGRAFDVGTPIKKFIEAVIQLEKKYGSRSRNAARVGVDWKSVHHAMRLTFEAEDLLKEGQIFLPINGERLDLLRQLKSGSIPDFDWSSELKSRIESITGLATKCFLPETAEMKPIEELHMELIGRRLTN